MLFNSLSFLIFFPLVTMGYFLVPQKAKVYWLLAASYYFYMCWSPAYALLLLFVTAVSYGLSLLLARTEDVRRRKSLLILNIAGCLGGLFVFKYLPFFTQILNGLAARCV